MTGNNKTNVSLKKAAKNLTDAARSFFRRCGFAVSGCIHAPGKFQSLLKFVKNLHFRITNRPEKYIPAAKCAAFAAASAVYVGILFSAAMSANGGYSDVDLSDDITLFPRNVGFLSEKAAVKIDLSWDDGVVELQDGEAKTILSASVEPRFMSVLDLSWETSDDSVANVSSDGEITAKTPGTVYITASLKDGEYSSSAKLQVVQPVTGLFMTTSNVTLYMGGSGENLKVKIFPSDATETTLKWHSENPEVAAVDSSGRVKPVSVGMTEITATTPDGKYTCKSFVTVVNYSVKVDTVNIENDKTDIKVGDSLSLIASVLPENAKNKTLSWSSSNEGIATVSQTGRVKAVAEGDVEIFAKAVSGVTASITVHVAAADGNAFDLNEEITNSTAPVIGTGGVTYTSYDITLPMIVQLQMGLSPPPQIWKSGGTVNATEAEVAEYMNPSSYCDDVYKYQFLDLSSPNGVTVEALDAYLADKGILKGMGAAFKKAAEMYNVSEVYLVAHACLESGNGTSQLSTGVEVNGTTVYNMFGIGAYDNSALYSGSQKAYKEGWTSPEAAILGGAEWISTYYINSTDGAQNTLYKMLWNPDNPGQHQYATDVGWAVKQAQSIAKIFEEFPDAVLSFNVPVYSGQTAPTVSAD